MKTSQPAVENLTVGLDLGDRHHACVLDAKADTALVKPSAAALTPRFPPPNA